jgi:hypothetical protein
MIKQIILIIGTRSLSSCLLESKATALLDKEPSHSYDVKLIFTLSDKRLAGLNDPELLNVFETLHKIDAVREDERLSCSVELNFVLAGNRLVLRILLVELNVFELLHEIDAVREDEQVSCSVELNFVLAGNRLVLRILLVELKDLEPLKIRVPEKLALTLRDLLLESPPVFENFPVKAKVRDDENILVAVNVLVFENFNVDEKVKEREKRPEEVKRKLEPKEITRQFFDRLRIKVKVSAEPFTVFSQSKYALFDEDTRLVVSSN